MAVTPEVPSSKSQEKVRFDPIAVKSLALNVTGVPEQKFATVPGERILLKGA
ncbi:hypothetical protein D3C86_2179090 [compost metagenome]